MPTQQVVAPRIVSLQYDGANANAVLTLVGANRNPDAYSVGSEVAGVLTLTPNPGFQGAYDPIVVHTGEHVVEPYGGVWADGPFADRYVVLA